MSSQIQITGETKVKSLTGVLTGTSGVVGFLPIDVSLGIPQLDVNGKILVSQLPNSVMEYQGTWNAATNTPYLVNGVGNAGDVWLVSTGGVHNFGAGAITFVVSDQVIFSNVAEGSIWQKASGSNGTVTSVALTESGDSLNITGSPITTSGTINIGFNGTNLQYVNGAGNLTTFPILTGYVTAVSGTAPVVSSGGTTPAISMAAATGSVDGYLLATDFAIFNAKQSALTFSSPLINTSGTISIPAATTSVNGYLASADFTTFNNKQNAITLTTTGTSGVSTLVGATLNIPNYGSALTGYVPYTGATQDVDLGAFSLNGKSLHIKGTAGNGHLGLKHQSAAATGSANESLIYADSLGDLSWQNANLYLSKFITSANTANRSYTFPNATCNIPDDSLVVHLAGTETITGYKTFDAALELKYNVIPTPSSAGYIGIGSNGVGITITTKPVSTVYNNNFYFASASNTFTFPNATGTVALTSDISYPVTSVFGRTGAVVATNGDYTTAQVTESGNLYYTDTRSRLALSFAAGMGAYNSATGVITIPTNNNQITNGSNYIALTSLSVIGPLLYNNTTGVFNINQASTTVSGWVSFTDFTTFNNKQGTITLTTTGTSGAATLVANTLNVPNYGSALSGYLPLTGGTLTGALGGTSASFSGALTLGGALSGTTATFNAGTSRIVLANNFNTTGNTNSPILSFFSFGDTATYPVTGPSIQKINTGSYGEGRLAFFQHQGTDFTNETEVVSIFANGNLAVGTTTDSGYKLDVNGTGRFSGDVTINGTNINVQLGSSTLPTTSNNLRHYFAGAATFVGQDGAGEANVGNNFYFNAAFLRRNTDYASNIRFNAGNIYLQVAASGAANSAITWTNALTIASTGAATFSIASGVYTAVNATSPNTSVYYKLTPTGGDAYYLGAGVAQTDDFAIYNVTRSKNYLTILGGASGGNVGIGTVSPYKLLTTSTSTAMSTQGNAELIRLASTAQSGYTEIGFSSYDNQYYSNVILGSVVTSAAGYTQSDFYIATKGGTTNVAPTERMRITSGGSVLIGTTDDGGKVVSYTTTAATQFKAAGTAPAITFSNTVLSPTIGGVLGVATAANHFFTGTASSDMVLANQFTAGALIFGTSNIERMRISVGGIVGIGDTGNASFKLSVTGTGGGVIANSSGSGDANFLSNSNTIGKHFLGLSGASTVFYVIQGGGVYSTSTSITLITSDRNLKTDILDYDKGLAEVLSMKPRYYKYKDNLQKQEIGFIAQEMDEALKGSMIDSIMKNEKTNENYKTYQLEWYPLLVNAIKEQQKQIEELKLKIK